MQKVATVLAAMTLAVTTGTATFAQGVASPNSSVAPRVTGTGTPNVNHTPCGPTSSQSNGTNSGANTFPNSSGQNQPGAASPSKGC
jgi:hypothetical protein